MSDACGPVRALLEDAAYGRVAPAEHALVERHLAACDACAAVRGRIDRQRGFVAAFAPRPSAPPALRGAILRGVIRPRHRFWLAPALAGAAAACLVLGLALVGFLSWSAPSAFERLAQEAVEDHVRVVLRSRTGPSGPAQAEALTALMERVLDYRVPLPAAAGGPFALAGGRPSYVFRQPIACFYYQAASAYASLFVIPLARLGDAGTPFRDVPQSAEYDAHRLAYWSQSGYAYVLVSDAASRELGALVAAMQRP